MNKPLHNLTVEELVKTSAQTIAHYQMSAQSYRDGTRNHNVSQNIDALLRHIDGDAPYDILDLGCGPGRDLIAFAELGHQPTGLDGCAEFVNMAKQQAGCEVWCQNFLELALPEHAFDGIFANASLFHVPTQELERVLSELCSSLKPGGILFSSNPRGPNIERYDGSRYSVFLNLETWRAFVLAAGFTELEHYYRPKNQPREQQPWLATVWRSLS